MSFYMGLGDSKNAAGVSDMERAILMVSIRNVLKDAFCTAAAGCQFRAGSTFSVLPVHFHNSGCCEGSGLLEFRGEGSEK